MKYAIIPDSSQHPPPLSIQPHFQRFFSDYHSSYSVAVTNDKLLKLALHRNLKEAQQEEWQTKSLEVPLGEEEVDWHGLKLVWCGQEEWFLVLEKPLRLYCVLTKYKSVVPIQLGSEVDLENMSCYVNFPELFIYGHEPKSFRNEVYTVNLQTFQTKKVDSSKDYSPKGRTSCWSLFSDGRLYVTGGLNKQGKEADQLLWTLNIENGYWFALDFVQGSVPFPRKGLNCEFENGKVLVVGKQDICVLELYQSQASEVEGWRELVKPEELEAVEEVFMMEGWLYLVLGQSVHPRRFKIGKRKG